jgi:NADH:ubiquinone reductase (H+-translocating)
VRTLPVHRIVVLGGGYAGLAFVRRLHRAAGHRAAGHGAAGHRAAGHGAAGHRAAGHGAANLQVTLIDQNCHHTLLTETHAVAAGARPASAVAVPFAVVRSGFRFVQARVEAVDPAQKLVHTDSGAVAYDTLAFCLGGTENDFGVPGVRQHAVTLRSTKEAEQIRRRVEEMPEGGQVVIVGGGLTGIELAAEMAMFWGNRRTVTVVEAAPHLLPGLPLSLRERARRRLGWLGVNLIIGHRATAISGSFVEIDDGSRLASRLTIWAAGVSGHPLVAAMGAAVDKAGRAIVDSRLRSSLPGVYVLGDSAVFRPAPDQPSLPPSGQLAEQMGLAAAADLLARLEGRDGAPFAPRPQGVLFDLGGLSAAGVIYRLRVSGLIALAAKRLAVWRHLWTVMGWRGLAAHLATVVRPEPDGAAWGKGRKVG